jgi:hypothetical protein
VPDLTASVLANCRSHSEAAARAAKSIRKTQLRLSIACRTWSPISIIGRYQKRSSGWAICEVASPLGSGVVVAYHRSNSRKPWAEFRKFQIIQYLGQPGLEEWISSSRRGDWDFRRLWAETSSVLASGGQQFFGNDAGKEAEPVPDGSAGI